MSTRAPSPDRPATEASQTEASQVEGYYWERCRRGAAPLVLGVLGLAALGAGQLLPLRHSAESDLRSRSQAALTGAGLTGITVDFTGQDGVLTGTVADEAAARRALDLVRGLEGVRVATSKLSFPGSGNATPAGNPTPSASTSPTGASTEAPTASSPAAPTEASTAASVGGSPSASPSPSASALPSGAATGTAVATPATPSGPATPSAPAPVAAERDAVAAKLRALPQISFAYGSSELTASGRASVVRAAALLKAAQGLRIRVDGFTDDLGDWDANMALSKARAEAVRRVLVANGVPAARSTAVGWSEQRPKVPNTSAANRAINRRVEIVVS